MCVCVCIYIYIYISEKKNQNTNWKRYMLPVFIAALFTIAKIWKQSKCSSSNEWIKKMCSKYVFLLAECS